MTENQVYPVPLFIHFIVIIIILSLCQSSLQTDKRR